MAEREPGHCFFFFATYKILPLDTHTLIDLLSYSLLLDTNKYNNKMSKSALLRKSIVKKTTTAQDILQKDLIRSHKYFYIPGMITSQK